MTPSDLLWVCDPLFMFGRSCTVVVKYFCCCREVHKCLFINYIKFCGFVKLGIKKNKLEKSWNSISKFLLNPWAVHLQRVGLIPMRNSTLWSTWCIEEVLIQNLNHFRAICQKQYPIRCPAVWKGSQHEVYHWKSFSW